MCLLSPRSLTDSLTDPLSNQIDKEGRNREIKEQIAYQSIYQWNVRRSVGEEEMLARKRRGREGKEIKVRRQQGAKVCGGVALAWLGE